MFHNIMNFTPVDRLPMYEWAKWWDKTITRWKKEGLNISSDAPEQIRDYLGLDMHRHFWVQNLKSTYPPVDPAAPDQKKTEELNEVQKAIEDFKKLYE